METDASVQGLGAVISQTQEDDKLHPIIIIVYASQSLSPGEKNYAITDLEILAVVWAISHFRPTTMDVESLCTQIVQPCGSFCWIHIHPENTPNGGQEYSVVD